jgi:hypothetical protein
VITVVGVHAGFTVAAFALGHGEDPLAGLRERGWAGRAVEVGGVLDDLTLRYAVEPLAAGQAGPRAASPQGPGLSDVERGGVVPHQRVAAYAVVVADERVLLTQLSERTGAGDRPGGG